MSNSPDPMDLMRELCHTPRPGEVVTLERLNAMRLAGHDVVGFVGRLRGVIAAAPCEFHDFDRAACECYSGQVPCSVGAFYAEPTPGQQARRPPAVPVPLEPSRGLLISMAVRLDHGLGVPGHYDQRIFGQGLGVTHARRLEMAIDDMRKVYEEISGNGFYRPEREAFYLGLEQPAPQPDNQGSPEHG